ncbi:sensor histidine kinase N-terminal domain-containing protein [Methylibium sp.]|uniref:sensor histidine kinase n=1 Tax=Methylibium sp. TaxID=2067992 RepID=UPI00286BFC6E|nr:sensor histidine kinase N-terminal domain-containing protein [Methylibium sp.]
MLKSLKATLMLWVVLVIALVVPLRFFFDVRGQLQRTSAAYDSSLSDWALALGNLVHMRDGEPQFDLSEQTERSLRTTAGSDTVYYVVLGPNGQWVAGDAPLAMPLIGLQRGERRLLDTQLGGQPLRMAVRAVECGAGACQVRVAETMGEREQTRLASVWITALLAGGGALLLALAIWRVVSVAMRPLASVNEQLAERSLDDLRPLRRGRMPSEVQPLVDAIDQLLQRVAVDASRQRHFIADAAHQLRTPLTALRTESELALLEGHPPAVHATLVRMHRSAQRVARLADQLLMLARTEASSREPGGAEPVDLKAVAQDAAQNWVPRALERGADLGFQLESAWLRGRRHLLGELLGNLVHNALEYAGDAEHPARITVRTALIDGPGAARAVLEVEDNGPGIDGAERERVFERFYRLPGSAGSGSGLGLAIVRDIALAHGASVTLLDAEDGGGLRVRVTFPAA